MQASLLLSAFLLIPILGGGQSSSVQAVAPWPAQPMPPDRGEDSYTIYSQLLPLGETGTWPATFYAVRDTTITAVAPDGPCSVPDVTSQTDDTPLGGMNPHTAISPPQKSMQDYREILADFDSHCHERLSLSPDDWKAKYPVHLLNQAEQDEFRSSRNRSTAAAEKYKGSPSLYGFSQVYFNVHHTVALVYATHWCGGLCGQGLWVALARENGAWKELRWRSANWIS
jgi:hypothetical protein